MPEERLWPRNKQLEEKDFLHSFWMLEDPLPTLHSRAIGGLLELSLSVSMLLSGFTAVLNPDLRILERENSKPTATLIWFWILRFSNLLFTICFSKTSNSVSKHSVQSRRYSCIQWERQSIILSYPIHFAIPPISLPTTLVENHIWCCFYFNKLSPLVFKL